MKIISTSDWHLGNLFHGNDRLAEHKHFLQWLLERIDEHQPDALLIAGDVFDNGNPSAAAQSAYYEFLALATRSCPAMRIIITAGNHDSANRLEAPRALLTHHRVEIRGNVRRLWVQDADGGKWQTDYDDLIIPINGQLAVLAVPYLRNDIVNGTTYSQGVTDFLRTLTARGRTLYPGRTLLMMAHMYAKGADIASRDASEKIIVGGQEEVNMEGWAEHPDYLTCGHIHKRQPIWGTSWARYTGSVLPMSFAEKDYTHGVDLIHIGEDKEIRVEQLVYKPQHTLRILPEDDAELTPRMLKRLIDSELAERTDGKLDEHFDYVVLKVKMEKVNNDDIKALENQVNEKNAVLCKIQKIITQLDVTTMTEGMRIKSIDDILNRNPMETLRESFVLHHQQEMNERQEQMLADLLSDIKNVTND